MSGLVVRALVVAAALAVPVTAGAQEVVPEKPAQKPAAAQPKPAAAQPKPAPAQPKPPPAAAPARDVAKTAAAPAPMAAAQKPPPAGAKSALPNPAQPKPGEAQLKPLPAQKPVPPKVVKRGPVPKKPSPTAKPGTPRGTPNDATRKRIAGSTVGDLPDDGDAELQALRDADRVLFPKPLPGSTPGFSWDLPRPSANAGAEIVASGLPPTIADDPGLGGEDEIGTDSDWIRSLTLPDLPVRLESRVVRYLKFYRDNAKGKAIARVWAKKSGRYVPALKAELARAGLPTDLVWLSVIESGHNPAIISPAGAAGLWQFMPEAGRVYGLTVDRWVDERLDPKRSTEAAVLYLSDLYRRFGSWELAMAAYNMGYGGLSKAIRKFNTNDYWELGRYEAGIPWETTLYVPKIFAIAIVMANKKAFALADVATDPAESFDSVVAAPGVSLERVASAAGVLRSTIEALNPQLLSGRVPPAKSGSVSRYKVRVPAGKGSGIGERLAKFGELEPELEPYAVKLGDTLSAIAAARGTTERALQRHNRLREAESLAAGVLLLVPRRSSAAATVPAAKLDEVVVVSPRGYRYPDRERVFYRVLPGDTLGAIASACGVTRAELESWNALDPKARLQSGMTLQVWVKSKSPLDGVRVVRESEARVLVAGTPGFFDYVEGQNGKKRISVEARAGDTLASIGKRYGMSVGWMERINRRSRKKELRPGDKLVVYVPAAGAGLLAGKNGASDGPSPLPDVEPPEPSVLPAVAPVEHDSPTEPAAADRQPGPSGG